MKNLSTQGIFFQNDSFGIVTLVSDGQPDKPLVFASTTNKHVRDFRYFKTHAVDPTLAPVALNLSKTSLNTITT